VRTLIPRDESGARSELALRAERTVHLASLRAGTRSERSLRALDAMHATRRFSVTELALRVLMCASHTLHPDASARADRPSRRGAGRGLEPLVCEHQAAFLWTRACP